MTCDEDTITKDISVFGPTFQNVFIIVIFSFHVSF